MIDNNFFMNTSHKDISKKPTGDKLSVNTKNNSYKDSWNSDVENTKRNNVNKDFKTKDVNHGFNKVLTEQKEKTTSYGKEVSKKSDINKVNDTGLSNKTETSKMEQSIEKVAEIINNDENFQGNKIDGEALEEIVALLNQIINSPEIKSLVPIKLEDPMLMSNEVTIETKNNFHSSNNNELNNILNLKNIEISNVDEIVKSIKSGISIDSNNVNNLEALKNLNNSKEALNLANTILETLNSKNVEGILSSDDIDGIKNVLEGLVDKIFKSDSQTITNVAIGTDVAKDMGEKIGSKEIKLDKLNEKPNAVIDEVNDNEVNSEVKSILTDLKSSLSSERNTTIKQTEISYMDKIGSVPEATNEEDRVLAKILGNDSIGGSLNRQDALLNRLNIKAPDVISEPMVVNKETMDADIIKNVKFMMKNQVSELKVKIYPKELGEMTIKLLSEEGILKADIKAVSKETYNLLNSNINDIKKSLEQQNIKIHEVNIGLYNDDTTYHSGENGNDEMFRNNENSRNKQGKDSSSSTRFLNEDFEDEENIYADSSVDLLV